jgi:hypothetical protein
MSDAEIDVEALRTELDQIKDAMGLRERYPAQFRLWLVYGLLVPLAAFGSQAVAIWDLPPWLHPVCWGGFMSVAGLFGWRHDDTAGDGLSAEAKPDIWFQFLAVFAFAVVVLALLGPVAADAPGDLASITIFAAVVGLVGVAYLVAGNSMKAYYVRRRDRYALYAGGVWMLALAAVLPHVEVLRTWGYATFGVVFGVHAVVSYAVLSGPD